jgi:aminoglycoside 6'-N-acetyltransferase I
MARCGRKAWTRRLAPHSSALTAYWRSENRASALPRANRQDGSSSYYVAMDDVAIRPAQLADVPEVAAMCHLLWPDVSIEEHTRDLISMIVPEVPGNLPAFILVAEQPSGRLVGFVQVGVRSHADGCNPAHHVGFIEGWYVVSEFRRRKVGARLIAAAEDWARTQNCIEMASDTWLDNMESQRAHEALGFEIVDRCVHYRKSL